MPRERKELTRLKVPALPKIHNKQAIARNKALNASEGLAYDCTLAARILEGNMGALDRLLERHLARINRFLQHRLGTGHTALVRDVTTATFDDALRHLKPYAQRTATTPMEYWLIGLAERNLGKVQRVKGKTRPTATAPPTTVRSTPQQHEDTADSDLAIVRRAMAGLSQQDSFVLALALFEGMSALEIASTLGIGEARALRRLRSALAAISKQLPTGAGAV
jgi:RNA polymerase sigma factor (sigma-70 family)